jgi:hypothetical protein
VKRIHCNAAGVTALAKVTLCMFLAVSVWTASLCAGAAPAPSESKKPTPSAGTRAFEQDLEYLTTLNKAVKEGRLTEEDRDRLWQAYMARIQGSLGPPRTNKPPGAIVAPAF